MKSNPTPEFLILYHELSERHEKLESWMSIAASFNDPKITRAHVYKIVVKKYEPRDNDLRVAFGLPAMKRVPIHLETYDPKIQEVKPIAIPGKRDTRIRLHTTVNRAIYEAVKGQAEYECTTMSEIVKRGLSMVLYDCKLFQGAVTGKVSE